VANGSVLSFINAAKQLLGKPYVWGGTTINGTDCSGLLYYAFNAAGIKMPRYRASDYGKMGQQVDAHRTRARATSSIGTTRATPTT
jgi:cell wall-associated NlpC family hydrolase